MLGIARGRVTRAVRRRQGLRHHLGRGDVVVLPAGTGHRRIRASRDLFVVAPIPPAAAMTNRGRKRRTMRAGSAAIAKVKLPPKDPVYGAEGALGRLWTKPARVRQRQVARARRAKARSAKARTAGRT